MTMRTKQFKDTVIKRDSKTDGENQYDYELILREGRRVANYKIPLYTVRVVMTDRKGKSTSASVKDAFADVTHAEDFYNKIVKCLATPIDLRYIIEDEMAR